TAHEDGLALEVLDDGRGIDSARAGSAVQAGHVGLAVARRRVEDAGGTFEIRTVPAGGTRGGGWPPGEEHSALRTMTFTRSRQRWFRTAEGRRLAFEWGLLAGSIAIGAAASSADQWRPLGALVAFLALDVVAEVMKLETRTARISTASTV